MPDVALPHDAKAGPTKSAVRSVLRGRLDLTDDDHFVEVGSCTGAVTVQAARDAGRVTALERKPERLETTRKNLTANGVPVAGSTGDGGEDGTGDVAEGGGENASSGEPVGECEGHADVELRAEEAPAGLPDDADAAFLGGSRNYEAVLDWAVAAEVDRVVMNVSRLEVAGAATAAFRERDLLEDVLQLQVSHGYELAGATSFDSENPVYVLVGSTTPDGADGAVGVDTPDVASDGGTTRPTQSTGTTGTTSPDASQDSDGRSGGSR